ncbi:MAG: hypothetical protein ACKV2T_09405 [Kofleriaceae bacterium]
MRIVFLMGLAVGISSRPAQACECDSSRNASPSTNVPLRGSVYIQDEVGFLRETSDSRPLLVWEGTAGVASLTTLSPRTVRVDYVGPPGSTLRIATSTGYESYRLRPDWQRPADPPRIGNVIHVVIDGLDADFVYFDFDQPAVAIRVRWTRDGRVHEWMDVQRTLTHLPEKGYSLGIGDLPCGGSRWMVEELWSGGLLEMFAIHADGTQIRIETPAFFSSAFLLRAIYGARPEYMANHGRNTGVGFEVPLVDVRDPSATNEWMLFAAALVLVMASLVRMSPTRTVGLRPL